MYSKNNLFLWLKDTDMSYMWLQPYSFEKQ